MCAGGGVGGLEGHHQSTGCEADMELGNAEPGVSNERIFPKNGQCLFRSLREASRKCSSRREE